MACALFRETPAADRPDLDLLRHSFEQRHRLLHERSQFGILERLGVRFFAGPQIDYPDDVGVLGGLADQVQEAIGVVVEQRARLEQDVHNVLALVRLRGELVEQRVRHGYVHYPRAAALIGKPARPANLRVQPRRPQDTDWPFVGNGHTSSDEQRVVGMQQSGPV